MESTVRAQGEFKMAAQFQSDRRQCRPWREAAVLVTILINWICHSSYTLPTAAHNTETLSLCILNPLIYATASVSVCCTFQSICCDSLWTFILININCVRLDVLEDVLNNTLCATISVYLPDCLCCRPRFFAVYLLHSL